MGVFTAATLLASKKHLACRHNDWLIHLWQVCGYERTLNCIVEATPHLVQTLRHLPSCCPNVIEALLNFGLCLVCCPLSDCVARRLELKGWLYASYKSICLVYVQSRLKHFSHFFELVSSNFAFCKPQFNNLQRIVFIALGSRLIDIASWQPNCRIFV